MSGDVARAVDRIVGELGGRRSAVGSGSEPEACSRCGRDSCAGDCDQRDAPRFALERLPAFLARVEAQPPTREHVTELFPDEAIVVWHGRPRSMKSLAALDALLAAATGTPAFGLERFAAPEPIPVAYLTEEDAERVVAQRLRWLVAGRGLGAAPARFYLRVRAGINLEVEDDRRSILTAVAETDARIVAIDPARAYAPSLDKGPADAASVIRFLRDLQRLSAAKTVLIVHHDVKPPRDQKDGRARAERASGGAVFSIADAPVGFERVDDRTCFAVPNAYKLSTDPKPFRIVFRSATSPGEPFKDWVRAEGSTTSERADQVSRANDRVFAVLREADDWMTSTTIADAAGGRRTEVWSALRSLAAEGKILSKPGPRKATFYRLAMGQGGE